MSRDTKKYSESSVSATHCLHPSLGGARLCRLLPKGRKKALVGGMSLLVLFSAPEKRTFLVLIKHLLTIGPQSLKANMNKRRINNKLIEPTSLNNYLRQPIIIRTTDIYSLTTKVLAIRHAPDIPIIPHTPIPTIHNDGPSQLLSRRLQHILHQRHQIPLHLSRHLTPPTSTEEILLLKPFH